MKLLTGLIAPEASLLDVQTVFSQHLYMVFPLCEFVSKFSLLIRTQVLLD